jgi:flavin reductase (DIM6/NTAB) family NADH-FMN oxidoreductase RutF
MNVHDQTAPVDARLFHRVMSRFATGVTVITAKVEGVARGMTASSFMSVSLSPPVCVVSIAINAQASAQSRTFWSQYPGPRARGAKPSFRRLQP